MESQEEKVHKLEIINKINETKDLMKRRARKIDKSKLVDRTRGEKGGFMPLQSMSSGSGFNNDMVIPTNGSGSVLGLSTDFDSFTNKSKGRPPASATIPQKGLGMQLGKSQKTN